jgi:predicted MPP superfamily phosphohydrolase
LAEHSQNFSERNLPGQNGNRFDTFLHAAEKINRINPIIFSIILLLIACLTGRARILNTLTLWSFFVGDWMLLALLPKSGRSYGPAKPTTVFLAILRSFFYLLPFPLSLIPQGLGTLLVIYGFWIEPLNISLTKEVLITSKFNTGKPIQLLHLGDLHIERISHREKELQRMIGILKPDVILFSGDILNLSFRTDPQAIEDARSVIRQWNAPLGVYFVRGSPAVDLPDIFPKLLEDLPVRWLNDEKISLSNGENRIDIIGLSCSHDPAVDLKRLENLTDPASENLTILLYHSPDVADGASLAGIDLQLSGHTHGGQVRLPFFGALYTASLTGKRFESGRSRVGNMDIYVTRGIGMEGASAPRIRFLCPPEITLWTIISKTTG